MKIYKKIIVMMAGVLLLAGLLSGCGKSDTKTTSADGVDLSNVTIRFGSTGWQSQKELLKAASLDDTPYKVEYSTFQGGNLCLEAMAADQIDFTTTSEIPPIYASLANNGGNFKIVAVNNSNTQDQEVVVKKDSQIKTIADLKGKKVGYIKSTTAQYFLYKMLEAAGLKWADINPVEITTADGVTALVGGQIDAFASYGNSINAAKAKGAVTLQSAENILSGNFPYEASNKALADAGKKAAIADYLARLELANVWQKANVEKWAQISADPSGKTYEDALDTLKRGFTQRDTHVLTIDDKIIGSEQSVIDAFRAIGLLEKDVKADTLYDKSLTDSYNKALEALKATQK